MSSAWLENMAAQSGALLIEEEEEEEEEVSSVNDIPEKIPEIESNLPQQGDNKPTVEEDHLKESEEIDSTTNNVPTPNNKYYFGPSNRETVNFAKNFTKVKAIQRLEYGGKLNFIAASLTEAKETAAKPLRITGDITSASASSKEKYTPLKEKIMSIPIPSKLYYTDK